jgi:tryptophanyl-tRNA synthetase
MQLYEDNTKLVEQFGADPITQAKHLPNNNIFTTDTLHSHRGFDEFIQRLESGEESAIVSGVNASGTLHYGHKLVFDINKYFQDQHGVTVYIPISDDESYVSDKVSTQEEGRKNAYSLAREILGYGFDPEKTVFIIDQDYPAIYNLAFKLSKRLTLSEIKATYGYKNSDNPGLIFYPTVQSAHVLLPEEREGIKNTLVPIGPDEDSHLRIARDLAHRENYAKPNVLHTRFLPGLDGKKMSKSKNNAIFLKDTEKELRKKVNKCFSGGQETLEEHRRLGGNPDVDMACQYLKTFFLDKDETKELFQAYRDGELLTGDVKNKLYEAANQHNKAFLEAANAVSQEDLEKTVLR